jgi:integrase
MDLNFYEAYKVYLLKKKNPKYGNMVLVKSKVKNQYFLTNKDEIQNIDQHLIESVGLFNDTISKNIATIKVFLQWAYERGFNIYTSYTQFKCTRKPKNDIVTLLESELNQLYNLNLSKNTRLEKVRDVFCFGCFTGQRWSDISSFRKEDVKDNAWEFISVKTKKGTKVPFVGFAKTAKLILEKYDYNLPQISAQKFNDYLKECGQLAEITSPITIKRYSGKKEILISRPKCEFMASHMARRTAVTILFENGVPPTTIMKLTRHADLRTVMKYENTSDDALEKELSRVGDITKKRKK